MVARVPQARALLTRYRHQTILGAIVLVALLLRFTGLNWDQGHLFHPDERHIVMTADRLELPWPPPVDLLLTPASPLNPGSFAYGSLPFYLVRVVTSLLGPASPLFATLLTGQNPGQLQQLAIVGRALSALFDVGTIVLVYLLGRRLYRESAGLLAAAFVAFAVLHVQLSHFYAVDTPMTFFVTATLLAATYLFARLGRHAAALTGALVGLALATKVSASPILGAVAAAYLLWLCSDDEGHLSLARATTDRIVLLFDRALVTAGVAAVTFVVVQPYALIDFATFVRHVAEQSAMVRGQADLPYTRQYIDRTPYLYFVENLVVFGLGLPLGIATIAGGVWATVRGAWLRRRGDLLLLAWVLPYVLITGAFHAKFLRYLLPVTPVLCLFAATMLLDLRSWLARADGPRHHLRHVATALAAFTLLGAILYALAFVSLYRAPHPAVAASWWVYANVPPGSAIATEHWEEGMPVALVADGRAFNDATMSYRKSSLENYEPDDARKLDHLVQQLDQNDYIIFFSNRLYGTIPRLPERYPLTTEFYRLLFGEQLGFELVAAFASYPNLLGVHLVDDTLSDPGLPTPRLLQQPLVDGLVVDLGRADESFTVYDHPKVLVFKKTRPIAAAELRAMLAPHVPSVPWSPDRPMADQFRSLVLTPAEQAIVRAGGTFRSLFDRSSFANQAPLLVWLVLVELLGLAAAPVAFVVLRSLVDRGFLFARLLGLLLLTWLGWMAVSLGLVRATRGTTFAAFVAVVLVGLAVAFWQRSALWAFVRSRWRLLLLGEGVFWAAFAFFLFVRASNPDLWHPTRGGEKPMDLAYLMAAIKSEVYPPYDPWFAGGYLNYYYYGQVLVGTLVKLSGIVPTTAYNLVVPLLFALTFSGAFAVGYNLSLHPGRRLVAGLAAGLFTCTMGNLGGFVQVATELARIGEATYQSAIPVVGTIAHVLLGLAQVLLDPGLLEIRTDWYWASTRVIEGTINEFPYFTFLYADLHAHLIALPITVLVIALAVEVVRSQPGVALEAIALRWPGRQLHAASPTIFGWQTPPAAGATAAPDVQRIAWGETLVSLFVVGLALGALMPTNSWDFPTYLGLIGLASVVPWYLGQRRTFAGLVAAIGRFAIFALLGIALYLPFHLRFQQFYTGFQPSPDQSNVGHYLIIHGFFLAVLLSYVAIDVGTRFHRSGALRTLHQVFAHWEMLPRYLQLRRRLVRQSDSNAEALLYAAVALCSLALFFALIGMTLVGLLLATLIVVGANALRRDHSPEAKLVYLLTGTGLALGIATELVALEGDVGRMNTVFKFYLQVWMMWALAAAATLPLVFGRVRAMKFATTRQLWSGALAVLLFAGFVYPVVATPARVADRFTTNLPLTLDGTAYMPFATYLDEQRPIRFGPELAALTWLQENVDGTPVVLEANTPLYRWGSRVSIYTGLPTVIGWDWHQTQQRWGYRHLIQERLRDVQTAYTTPSVEQTLSLLHAYQVEYVVVGDVERAYYPESGLQKFDAMVGEHLDLVYNDQGVKIYRVRQVGEG